MQNPTFKLNDVRFRREILIQAQQLLQQIDDCEDQLELFQNFDQPTYQLWFDTTLCKEKQQLEELEREYTATVRFHNSMVAIAKLRNISMPRAYEMLREEQTAYANGNASLRLRIEEDRLKREHFIRNDLETEFRESVPAPPALPPPAAVGGIEAEQLKLVYRKLVRRLHPDLQGPDADAGELRWQKRIWNLLLQARQRGDIQEIEKLYKVTLLRQMEFAELTVPEAHEVYNWLGAELERLNAETWQARQNPAWGFSQLQDLRALAQRSRQSLHNEMTTRRAEIDELESQHAYLEVASHNTPVKRKRAPRRDENQLSLFD